ncbi:MAG: hypothetical protein ABIO70_14600 [Pseudomonadota bacterium]
MIAPAHDPEDRYPTARDMINYIQRSFSLVGLAGTPALSFRNLAITVAVGATLTGLTLGGWALLR